MLGEYGIIGLITILFLLYNNYKDNQTQVKAYGPVGAAARGQPPAAASQIRSIRAW